MKKLNLTFCFILFLTILTQISSNPNPVITFFINEFMFDPTGWKLELHPSDFHQDSLSLDDWYLTSRTDTAHFKSGIYLNGDRYLIITQDSMQSQLNINPVSDTLTLYQGVGFRDRLCFGSLDWYSISTPKIGQSICLKLDYGGYTQDYFYFLDNSPTIGLENDTLDVKGNVEGFVKDSVNNPIPGVKVVYDYIELSPSQVIPIYVETNSSGYFNIHEYARVTNLEFEKEGYFIPDTLLQIWPDSTITLNIQMNSVVGITELPSPIINNFELTQNYPNPFNGSTTFIYSILEEGYVEINIYDEKGELIQQLFNGNQSKGQYKVNWNADNRASGIYFYELKTGNQKISKKCLLLK